jgi:5-methylcytosine-specific restriction protein B
MKAPPSVSGTSAQRLGQRADHAERSCSRDLARFKAGAGLVEVVQFHPAYGYEDFIQGIRPEVTTGGQLTYGLVDGSFKGFCARVAAVAPQPAVLVVDEINRANVPRVFGELMYLLEYRGDTVPLAAGGNLRIPNNLFLIGTMNTADRSIAKMDHALRRRFAFWRLEPRYETLAARLRERNLAGVDELVEVLRAVNDAIRDPNYAVGISFFMRDDIRTAMRDVWEGEIEPYLEEFFFDDRPTAERFRWARLVGGDLAAWRGDE